MILKKTHLAVERESKEYLSALKREMEMWDRVYKLKHQSPNSSESALVTLPSSKKKFSRKIVSEENVDYIRYCNWQIGSNSDSVFDWIDFAYNRLGSFESGLSIGSGEGIYEKYMEEIGFVKKFKSVDIVDPDFENSDLNFIDLQKEKYDLILAKSVIHHLVNIEHVLFQIVQALKPGGVFLVRDHIGENRHIWKTSKLDFLNKKFKERYGNYIPDFCLQKPIRANTKPFECIRSEDIPEVLDYYFRDSTIFEYKWGALSYSFLSLIKSEANRIRNERILIDMVKYAIILDIKYGHNFQQCSIFAAYSKSMNRDCLFVKPWNYETRSKYFTTQFNLLPLKRRVKEALRVILGKINPEIYWL